MITNLDSTIIITTPTRLNLPNIQTLRSKGTLKRQIRALSYLLGPKGDKSLASLFPYFQDGYGLPCLWLKHLRCAMITLPCLSTQTFSVFASHIGVLWTKRKGDLPKILQGVRSSRSHSASMCRSSRECARHAVNFGKKILAYVWRVCESKPTLKNSTSCEIANLYHCICFQP